MTTPDHPVTLGDLRVVTNEDPATPNEAWWSFATVADLVSALRAEGVLVVEKVEGEWPGGVQWTIHQHARHGSEWARKLLDALAEAQP